MNQDTPNTLNIPDEFYKFMDRYQSLSGLKDPDLKDPDPLTQVQIQLTEKTATAAQSNIDMLEIMREISQLSASTLEQTLELIDATIAKPKPPQQQRQRWVWLVILVVLNCVGIFSVGYTNGYSQYRSVCMDHQINHCP